MTARDGYFAVIAVRPRPASKRRRRVRPALGRTATLPSVPVHSDPGRTGRLTSLLKSKGREKEKAKKDTKPTMILRMATHVTAKQSHNAGR
jgi:hypothetical protein